MTIKFPAVSCLICFFWPVCCQKTHQLSLEEHQELMDIVCLWSWLRPKIHSTMEVSSIQHLDTLFDNGILGRKCGVLGGWLNFVKSMFLSFFCKCFGSARTTKTRHTSRLKNKTRQHLGMDETKTRHTLDVGKTKPVTKLGWRYIEKSLDDKKKSYPLANWNVWFGDLGNFYDKQLPPSELY